LVLLYLNIHDLLLSLHLLSLILDLSLHLVLLSNNNLIYLSLLFLNPINITLDILNLILITHSYLPYHILLYLLYILILLLIQLFNPNIDHLFHLIVHQLIYYSISLSTIPYQFLYPHLNYLLKLVNLIRLLYRLFQQLFKHRNSLDPVSSHHLSYQPTVIWALLLITFPTL